MDVVIIPDPEPFSQAPEKYASSALSQHSAASEFAIGSFPR